jgi:hypothetical protein
MTSGTTIVAATFAFGTTPGADLVPGTYSVRTALVLEPSSMILFACRLGALGLFGFIAIRAAVQPSPPDPARLPCGPHPVHRLGRKDRALRTRPLATRRATASDFGDRACA